MTTGAAKTILNSTDSGEISNQQTNVFVAAKSRENTANVTIKLTIFSCVSNLWVKKRQYSSSSKQKFLDSADKMRITKMLWMAETPHVHSLCCFLEAMSVLASIASVLEEEEGGKFRTIVQ